MSYNEGILLKLAKNSKIHYTLGKLNIQENIIDKIDFCELLTSLET